MTPRPAPHLIRWCLKAFGYAGICLPPMGIYILAAHLHSQRLIRHEKAHWRQYQRLGAVRFYAAYVWGLARHGYRNHPMELEARAAEGTHA
jgi:hypothetical protein